MQRRKSALCAAVLIVLVGSVPGCASSKYQERTEGHSAAQRVETLTANPCSTPLPPLPFYVRSDPWNMYQGGNTMCVTVTKGRPKYDVVDEWVWYCDATGQCQSPPPYGILKDENQ